MFKPDSWQSHDEYRTIVHSFGCRLSPNNPHYHFDLFSVERQKLLNLNLDPLRDFIAGFFSPIGRPAKNQAQILRSLLLFVFLFNRTPARTSLTAWVYQVLPNSISLPVLSGFTSTDHLPPLGSYYDFMNRLCLASRDIYSRPPLLSAGKNGRKPDKVIGTDGKLSEDDHSSESSRTIVDNILNGTPASDNPEAALQEIFSILAVLPSVELGLVNPRNLTLSGDGTAVVSHSSPYGKHLPAALSAPSGVTIHAIIPIQMPAGDGTAITAAGILVTPCICSAIAMIPSSLNFPCP